MTGIQVYLCLCVAVQIVSSYRSNDTFPDAASQQLEDFRRRYKRPIGVLTKVTGEPLDITDTVTLNTEIFDNRNHFRLSAHQSRERIPERVVHAQGVGAYGYFEVTHDVSKYIKANVFNGIGNRTPLVVRFSTARQNIGGSDLIRDTKSFSIKFYTKEGNLDFLTFHIPVFTSKDPIDFVSTMHSVRRNPRSALLDNNMLWDFIVMKPDQLHSNLWIMSDLGIPNGYRKTNYFALHTFEIYNNKGDRFFVKFNLVSETGIFNLTNAEASAIRVEDPNYFNRDLYNAIAAKKYPSWRLIMEILTEDLTKIDFDPFDMTRTWKRGTYHTVTIGRLVINRNVDNHFKDTELCAFSPDNLVPGIIGPHDIIFRARRLFYPDAQNYRLGVNHDNVKVNAPRYQKTYSRDGVPPVLDNMKDAPNYYPNSFNGPMPYIDENRPRDLPIILHSNSFDLQPDAEFYNEIVDSDSHRQRIAENIAQSMTNLSKDVKRNVLWLLTHVAIDLGKRVREALRAMKMVSPQTRRAQLTQCFS